MILGKQPEKLAQPSILRVPETIFTDRFDYRLDLWRAGCMVCQYSVMYFITAKVLILVWTLDLRFLVHDLPFLAFWRGRITNFPSDWFRGETASRMGVSVGRNADEIKL